MEHTVGGSVPSAEEPTRLGGGIEDLLAGHGFHGQVAFS